MQKKVIYLADDLTGACDTASYICDYTGEAIVILNNDEIGINKSRIPEDNDAAGNFVISTNTRDLSVEDARLKLHELGKFLTNVESRIIFKKIDSAFRGNVVLEINTLMDIFNKNICFIINCIPSMDRITLGGFQLIKGKLLDDSEFIKDPVKAPVSPFIPYLFTENNQDISSRKTCHVFLETVRYGDILNVLRDATDKNISIFSFDAVTKDDIEKIVDILYREFGNALFVGTLGLLEALNKKIFKNNQQTGEINKKHKNFETVDFKKVSKSNEKCFGDDFTDYIGFTSSKYEITKKQIDKLKKKKNTEIYKIKINDFLNKKDKNQTSKIVSISDEIVKNYDKSGLFVITEFKGKKEPQKLSGLILRILSEISVNILKSLKFGRIILIGGETALSILKTFKVSNIKIMGRIIDGISYGIVSDGLLEGKGVLIKGGSVGDANSIINMVNFEF